MRTLYFVRRQSEPEQMSDGEDAAFATVAKKYYRPWFVVPAMHAAAITNKERVYTVVDVGCGPGFFVKALANAFRKSRVVGVDISLPALRTARRMCKGKRRTHFCKGSAYALPFPTGSIDVVVSRDAFHHFHKSKKALREMYRVLRPGGRLYIQDLRRDLPFALLKEAIPRQSTFQKLQYYSVRAAYTPKEMERLIREAGFVAVRVAGRRINDEVLEQVAVSEKTIVRRTFSAHLVASAKKPL